MKKIVFVALLLGIVSLSPIEYDRALILRVEDLMKLSPSTKSFSYQGNGWFEFTDENGLTWQRNFGDTRTHGGLKPKKIISIDLRMIDTTEFGRFFKELSVIHVGVQVLPPISGRMDSTQPALLIGQYYIPGPREPVRIYQRNRNEDNFIHVYSFSNGFFPNSIYDFDGNKINELVADSLGSIITFEQDQQSMLPINRKHFWEGKTGSAQVPRIADLDGDGFPEITMHQFGNGFHGTRVVKYDTASRILKKIFQIRYPNNPGFRGYWAIGDFDLDREQEFVTANYAGEVYFVEHVTGDTSYAISFSDTTRFINAFFHIEGNDLDGDGRPECFIGSDNTVGLHNIAVYERTGDNIFEVSSWIEIFPLGSFVWPWIWTGDVDGDSKDEIVLSSVNTLIVLKAYGDDDYRVIWYKRYESEISHRLFDIDQNGTQDILLSFVDSDGYHKTRILTYNTNTLGNIKIDKNQPLNWQVSPNPTSRSIVLNISGLQPGAIEFQLYSHLGNQVMDKMFTRDDEDRQIFTFDVQRFQSGLYYAVLIYKGKKSTKKIIIIH